MGTEKRPKIYHIITDMNINVNINVNINNKIYVNIYINVHFIIYGYLKLSTP